MLRAFALPAAAILFASACRGSDSGSPAVTQESTGATRASVTNTTRPPEPTSIPGVFVRSAKPIGESDTIQGLVLTLTGVGVTTVELLEEFQDSGDGTVFADYADSQSIVIVYLEADNPTSETQTLHSFTGTTALINDEQLDADFQLSDLETEILPGARVEMYAVFVSERYPPEQVNRVRFQIEKTFTLEGTGVYDFVVEIP